MTYTPTEWSTAEDKQRFADHFKRFVESNYKRTLFYKWFYTRLSMCFGFIAHYNIHGFYGTYFECAEDKERFENIIMKGHAYMGGPIGDPAWTWVDVERDLMEWMRKRKGVLLPDYI